MPKNPGAPSTGAELLDVVVRLNRWVTHHSSWALPLAQVRLLSQINAWGTARVTDLAREEHCSQPTMTARVQGLEAQGWLARAADPEDARSTLLTLTEEGRAVLAEARGKRARVLEALMARLDAGERQRLEDATAALHALLDAAYSSAPDAHTHTSES